MMQSCPRGEMVRGETLGYGLPLKEMKVSRGVRDRYSDAAEYWWNLVRGHYDGKLNEIGIAAGNEKDGRQCFFLGGCLGWNVAPTPATVWRNARI